MENQVSVYSESVEKKFQEWMEKYRITEEYEFQVKTLLALQEEYNEVTKTQGDHTKRRDSLLGMINSLHSRLPNDLFREKENLDVNVSIDYLCKISDKPFIRSLWDSDPDAKVYIRAVCSLPQYRDLTYKDSIKYS